MTDGIRIYSIVISFLVIIIGTAQIRHWWTFGPQIRLLWLSAAAMNFTVFIGSIEAMRQNNPGGYRVLATALGATWLFATVLYRPATAVWGMIRRKEQP